MSEIRDCGQELAEGVCSPLSDERSGLSCTEFDGVWLCGGLANDPGGFQPTPLFPTGSDCTQDGRLAVNIPRLVVPKATARTSSTITQTS